MSSTWFVAISSELRSRFHAAIRGEEGSMIPISLFYFLITLILTFALINLTHSYIDRRHLILVTESALQSASQNLDERSYYWGYQERNRLSAGFGRERLLLPIDCNKASRAFPEEFRAQWSLSSRLNQGAKSPNEVSIPTIIDVSCDGMSLRSTVKVRTFLPFPVTFAGVSFYESFDQQVQVTVGSVVGG